MNSARKETGMNLFGNQLNGFAKALVILAAILLVSCGLCGLSLGLAATGGRGHISELWGQIVVITAVGFGVAIVLSVLGIGIVAIVWAISIAVRSSKENPQGLPDPN